MICHHTTPQIQTSNNPAFHEFTRMQVMPRWYKRKTEASWAKECAREHDYENVRFGVEAQRFEHTIQTHLIRLNEEGLGALQIRFNPRDTTRFRQ